MDKESYSVDDILSEVKKRREENEARLNQEAKAKKPVQRPEKISPQLNSSKEEYVNNLIDAVMGPEPEVKKEQPAAEEKKEPENPSQPASGVEPERKQKPMEDFVREPATEDTADLPVEELQTAENNLPQEEIQPELLTAAQPEENKMVDLFSITGEEEDLPSVDENKQDKISWRKTKKGKIIISVICVLVVLIIGGIIFGVCYVNGLLDKFTGDKADDYQKTDTSYHGMDFLEENFPAIEEMDASEATTYKEYLKWWYENGDPVSSTHVQNILLIGEDTREEEISDTSRADSAIIASVNIDTGKITLTSILRDLYVYYEKDGEGQYGKINEAASVGGMKEYIRTVERYYKIQIDNYAVVNFASFPKIIDSLGGVEIKITDREINEINNHPKRYGDVVIEKTYEGTEGKIKLSGKQALAYCRIRKIDSDGARADRQKTVLLQLFKKMKGASKTELIKVVNDLVGYVYTGYSKKELISLATYALTNGWLSYETQTTSVPTPEHARGGNFLIGPTQVTPCKPGQGIWLWKSDIPQDAYDLQILIYGKSNITLAENRCKYVDIV